MNDEPNDYTQFFRSIMNTSSPEVFLRRKKKTPYVYLTLAQLDRASSWYTKIAGSILSQGIYKNQPMNA